MKSRSEKSRKRSSEGSVGVGSWVQVKAAYTGPATVVNHAAGARSRRPSPLLTWVCEGQQTLW